MRRLNSFSFQEVSPWLDPNPEETATRLRAGWNVSNVVLFDSPRGQFSDAFAVHVQALAVIDELDLRTLRGEPAFPRHAGFIGRTTVFNALGIPVQGLGDEVTGRVETNSSEEWTTIFLAYLKLATPEYIDQRTDE